MSDDPETCQTCEPLPFRSRCQLPLDYQEQEPPKKNKWSWGKNNFSLGLTLLSWGICLLLFPKWVGLDQPLAGVAFVVGFVFVLIGLLITFLEAFPEKEE